MEYFLICAFGPIPTHCFEIQLRTTKQRLFEDNQCIFETNTLTVYTITSFFAMIFPSISFHILHIHLKKERRKKQQGHLNFEFPGYQEDQRQMKV